MNWTPLGSRIAILLVATVIVADQATAEILRYRQSGDWTDISDGTSNGWAKNNGAVHGSLPGAADDARINFGNNTVSVNSAVPAVSRVQIGVDESGIVEVNNGGVLTANQDILAGNNNSNATGTLIVKDGGEVNVGRILWAAQTDSDGVIEVQAGGVINVASHLWLGVTGSADIDIFGTVNQTGGILGLGTDNASAATGGTATVDIQDGGLLALNNISGAAGLPSVQAGSLINIEGSGELTVPGDVLGLLNSYVDANKIAGAGVPGSLSLVVDLTKNPGFTTVYLSAIPEPTSLLLIVAGLPILGSRRR